jgi:hypothetical protein
MHTTGRPPVVAHDQHILRARSEATGPGPGPGLDPGPACQRQPRGPQAGRLGPDLRDLDRPGTRTCVHDLDSVSRDLSALRRTSASVGAPLWSRLDPGPEPGRPAGPGPAKGATGPCSVGPDSEAQLTPTAVSSIGPPVTVVGDSVGAPLRRRASASIAVAGAVAQCMLRLPVCFTGNLKPEFTVIGPGPPDSEPIQVERYGSSPAGPAWPGTE